VTRALDLEIVDRVCALLTDGHSRAAAAAEIGVTPRELSAWIARGRAEGRRGTLSLYSALSIDVERAEAAAQLDAERTLLSILADPEPTAPVIARLRAMERHLERRYARDWGQTGTVRLQRALEALLDDVQLIMSPASWAELVRAIAAVQGSDDEALASAAVPALALSAGEEE